MEQPIVSGVMYDKNQSKITIRGVPDQPGIASRIFGPLAESSISLDMIIQNMSDDGLTDITFTLPKTQAVEATNIMKQTVKIIKARELSVDSDISKISIVGAGMRSHSGVAAKMFKAFSRENINLMMISTSEIRISCIIETKYTELAVRILHEEFNLKLEPKVPNMQSKTKTA